MRLTERHTKIAGISVALLYSNAPVLDFSLEKAEAHYPLLFGSESEMFSEFSEAKLWNSIFSQTGNFMPGVLIPLSAENLKSVQNQISDLINGYAFEVCKLIENWDVYSLNYKNIVIGNGDLSYSGEISEGQKYMQIYDLYSLLKEIWRTKPEDFVYNADITPEQNLEEIRSGKVFSLELPGVYDMEVPFIDGKVDVKVYNGEMTVTKFPVMMPEHILKALMRGFFTQFVIQSSKEIQEGIDEAVLSIWKY